MCSTVAVPFYIPTHQQFQFFRMITNISFFLPLLPCPLIGILVGVKCSLIVVLLCVSLMVNDVEYFFFLMLLAMCISLEKYRFMSFAHF